MPATVRQLPTAAVSPELAAHRKELGILHNIFSMLTQATIKAGEWQQAGEVLGYLDGRILAVQAQADALTEVEGDDGNQTPDPDSTVIPDLGKAEAH